MSALDMEAEILNRLDQIQQDLEEIKEKLNLMAPQTQKMDRHVDFVNDIYDSVKQPFHFICHKATHLMGRSYQLQEPETPQISN